MRKGNGITGAGVSNMSAHLSGRLTFAMLQKMHQERIKGQMNFNIADETDRVKKLLVRQERLDERKEQLEKDPGPYSEV